MFWVVCRNPEFILAGNFVYVGLLLIPVFFFLLFWPGAGKINTTHKHWIVDDKTLIYWWTFCVFCVVRFWFFSHMFLHKIYTVPHLTHIGWWGISPTGTLLVTDASEMFHTSSSGYGGGVQTHLLQGWGHEMVYLPGGTVGYPAQPGLTWRNRRLPSPTRINSSLHLSFCPSVSKG